jgi:uncharacterized membrane protein YoaK (UPF0700 family)
MKQPALHDDRPSALIILLVMTFGTGIVDAVSFLALGRVFTANMTGNVTLLGFALGGAPRLSVSRSLLALACFLAGAVVGGRMTASLEPKEIRRRAIFAFGIEALLLLTGATLALGLSEPYETDPSRIYGLIAITAVAMGLRNAAVRRLGVPDMTTTVLTSTMTALASDSAVAGGDNLRWKGRSAAILAMLGGAAAGTLMLRRSVAMPLCFTGIVTTACAFAWLWMERSSTDQ